MKTRARAEQDRVGGIFGDILGAVVEPFADVFTSAVDRVPGGNWAKQAIEDGATWLGDAAKTFPGYQAIAIVSASLAQGVAAAYGVNLVALAMVAPGLAAGKDVQEAFITGTADYLAKLAIAVTGLAGAAAYTAAGGGVLGVTAAGAAVAAGGRSTVAGVQFARDKVLDPALNLLHDERFQKAMADLGTAAKQAGLSPKDLVRQMGLTPQKLAADYGMREDAVAIAANGSLGATVFDLNMFDPVTGRVPGSPTRNAVNISRELAVARHNGQMDLAARLQREMNAAIARESAGAPPPPLAGEALDDAVRRAATLFGSNRPVEPVPVGFVRVVRDEGVTARRLEGLGTFALFTAPLWGYALLRHRRDLGALLGRIRR